jgi:FKBP-type peptidyl-prolyl cis-trans isomerase
MERILSILALVAAIGVGAYTYVTTDRQKGEIGALNQKVETLSKKSQDSEKALAKQRKDFDSLVAALTGQAPPDGAPPPGVDMTNLSDEKNAAFLDAYAKKDGVTKRPSGLMYRVIKAGPDGGAQPKPDSEVTINYKGAFIDGTEFDSSAANGGPVTFPLPQLIPGWVEALPLMKEGDAWEVVVPYQLGYGEKGRGTIPGKQTLVFEIELVKAGK